MQRTTLQKAAAGWCLLMAAALTALQASPLPSPPAVLFVVFTSVWLFGAAMLWWFPTFGGIGTALYGLILGVQLLVAHGTSPMNLALTAGSFLGTGLAIAFLVERWQAR